jgi:type IV secretion system protein VirB9
MPALFVAGESGEGERVNYLVRGRFLVVQRLADRLLLRLGRAQVSVERLQPLDGPDEGGSLPALPFPDGASQ